jgi:hypothetical protein
MLKAIFKIKIVMKNRNLIYLKDKIKAITNIKMIIHYRSLRVDLKVQHQLKIMAKINYYYRNQIITETY